MPEQSRRALAKGAIVQAAAAERLIKSGIPGHRRQQQE
jgi:hypothetical protein